ncbi:hypothetical protein [Alteromonas sp. H39]|uniref:hypothetical protein n=1 Tax=Alteromonas sp. H39 TaxID=3389876 RepID=UPI0039E0C484
MRKRIRWLCFLAVFLTGCSTVTVHVNTRYLSEQETREIVNKLTAAEFTVKTNTQLFPSQVSSTTILYSPLLQDREAIFRLEKAITSDWPVSYIQALSISNHWYTKSSIGLYVVPANVNPHRGTSSADLANVYTGWQCKSNVVLNLHQDGTFTLQKNDQTYSGDWKITRFPYLQLSGSSPYLHTYFEVSQHGEVDKISPVTITSLTPLENDFLNEGCVLTFGLRDN